MTTDVRDVVQFPPSVNEMKHIFIHCSKNQLYGLPSAVVSSAVVSSVSIDVGSV